MKGSPLYWWIRRSVRHLRSPTMSMFWSWDATSSRDPWEHSPIWRKHFGYDMIELMLYNGSLTTQDPNFPDATSLAIANQRILSVGTDAEIRALATSGTRQIDLGVC